jgi:hypothetical protein
MNKIFTLAAAMLLCSASFGQSQRLVLFEEFTGETCGPCAATNPGLNAMLNANEDKVVSIKYQNNIPSAGPRFWQYNTTEISARQTYYANNYSPQGFLDGNVFNDNAGALDPTIINNRYVVPSPFTIRVEHSFSAANDTIYATAIIKASQSYTGTNLVGHVVVTERDIFGYTSPNGENHYEGVMRKMLPNNAGTPLQANWNAGDSIVLNYSWYITPAVLSSPVYYQLSVVSFVQENSNKEVLQAGFSRAQVPLDPKARNLSGIDDVNCSGNIVPTLEIFNNGLTPITSLDIQYKLDNAATQTYTWTGNLNSFTNTIITLPSIPVASTGSHNLLTSLVNPNNGATDNNLLNNDARAYFGTPTAAVGGNVTENFLSTTFPPANWMRVDQNGNSIGWTRNAANAYVTGSGSAKIDYYSSPTGNIDNLYIYTIDMSTAPNATLTFDVAHRQYSADYLDELNVQVSTDCGNTWNTVWSKSGTVLATVTGYQTSAFTPAVAQWRSESVNLASYIGNSDVLIRFNAVSGYGNNAYIDNVNVDLTTGIKNNTFANAISVFPNPSKDKVNIHVQLKELQTINMKLMDVTGRVVAQQSASGTVFTQVFNLNGIAAGSYVLQVESEGSTFTKNLVVE